MNKVYKALTNLGCGR